LRACLQRFKHAQDTYRHPNIDNYKPDNPFLSERILENYPLQKRYKAGELEVLADIPVSQKYYKQYLYKKALYTYIGELETKLGLATGIQLRDPTRDIRMLEFCANLPYHLFAYHGIPRWLVRENLQDVLPASILENWMRYGVQNSDWLLRIHRDFPDIKKFVQSTFSVFKEHNKNHVLSDLIDDEKVFRFISSAFTDDSADSSEFFYLCFIISMACYINTAM